MKPILYAATEQEFDNNGIGILSDVISCTVTEERNGAFEMEMEYPVTGIHFAELALHRIILTKPNPVDQAQPFRIYRISRPLGGSVTVYAEHISYDLSGIPVSPFTAQNCGGAMEQLGKSMAVTSPFRFYTDKATAGAFSAAVPSSARSLLGGTEGSLLDVYGGEYKFDRFDVRLMGSRGKDSGASIRYGKNLTDIKQEENCESVYTGVYPYWTTGDPATVKTSQGKTYAEIEGESKIVYASGNYDFVRIKPLDLSDKFESPPTSEQLKDAAKTYIENNRIGVPAVSLDVSFAQLEQTEEYKNFGLLEDVELCDTVTVEFPAMNVSATAQVNKTVYNPILERYDSVTVGDAKYTIADKLAQDKQKTDQKIVDTKTHLQDAVDRASELITGNSGGYVLLHDGDNDGYPDEILILDKPEIQDAVKVWRWNQGGLGYSGSGYSNGKYGTAITNDGHIVANFVDTGILTANVIRAGVLEDWPDGADDDPDKGGKVFYLDLVGGDLRMNANKLAIQGVDLVGSNHDGIWIEGGKLYINASMLKAGTLQVGPDGNIKFKASIDDSEVLIGGFNVSSSAIYNKMPSFDSTVSPGIYLGTDGIALGGGKFKVNSKGEMNAKSGTFEGNIYAKNIQSGNEYGYVTQDMLDEAVQGVVGKLSSGSMGSGNNAGLFTDYFQVTNELRASDEFYLHNQRVKLAKLPYTVVSGGMNSSFSVGRKTMLVLEWEQTTQEGMEIEELPRVDSGLCKAIWNIEQYLKHNDSNFHPCLYEWNITWQDPPEFS